MITNIRLKNWRSHLDSSLSFSKGTNALIGILGSGKSSVMNALCFGLFGTFPDLQTRKIKLDDIIMNKPMKKNTSEIIIDFNIDGKKYSVMRVIEKGKGTTYSEIKEGDKLLESPNAQRVTEIIENTLKINYEVFSKAIYSEQNNIDYFLKLPKGERMKRMDNLLMIDKFEKARTSSTILKNKMIDIKLGKQSIIDQIDIIPIKRNLDELKKNIEETQSQRKNLSINLEKINLEKELVQNKLDNLEKLNEQLIELNQQKSKIETSINENKKSIESIEKLLEDIDKSKIKEKINSLEKEMESISEKYKEKKLEYEKLTREISRQKARIDFLEKDKINSIKKEIKNKIEFEQDLNKLKQKYKNPEFELKNIRNKLEITGNKLSVQLTQQETIQKSLQEIELLENKCPVCESSITTEKKNKLIEQKNNELKKLELNIAKSRKNKILLQNEVFELEDIVDKFKKYSGEIEDMTRLKNQLEVLIQEYSNLKNNFEKNQKVFDKTKEESLSLEKNLENKRNERNSLNVLSTRINEYDMRKKTLDELEIQNKEIFDKITETKNEIGNKKIDDVRKTFNEIIRKTSELKTKVENFDEIVSEKINRKKEYEEKIDSYEKEKNEIKKYEQIIKELKIFSKALEETQVQLRKEFIDTVNYTMSTIWSNIYPYEDFVGARLDIVNRDYVLQLKERTGDWIEVDRIASGGERSIACLVLRIAFALVLAPQLKWLVLDEPTHNLDRKAIEDLSQTLRTRAGEFIEQIFLITHDEKLEESVTGQLYRLEREKGKDGFTKIIQIN